MFIVMLPVVRASMLAVRTGVAGTPTKPPLRGGGGGGGGGGGEDRRVHPAAS